MTMSAVMQEPQHHYLAEFERVAAARAGDAQPWLHALRRTALAAGVARGFPTAHDEDWKYTRTAAIEKRNFVFRSAAAPVDAARIRTLLPDDSAARRIVLVGGRYRPEWSRLDGVPAGAPVVYLAAALNEPPPSPRAALAAIHSMRQQD